MKKVNLCGRVPTEVIKEFNENIKRLEGRPFGSKGRGLETSIRILNNYFKPYEGVMLIDIAYDKGLQPWELGELIIKDWVKHEIQV